MEQIRNVLDLMRRGEGLRFEVRHIMLYINRLNKLHGSPFFPIYNMFVVDTMAEILSQYWKDSQ